MADLPHHIKIGTRGSRLALWQAEQIEQRLRQLDIQTELVIVKTLGDRDHTRAFGQTTSGGIFVKEIEESLCERRIDLAVHSLKDLPTGLAEGLVLAAVAEREDPRDALVSREGITFDALPAGSRVATGSPRRAAQILALRPDLEVVPMRGNVPTRIEKIRRGEADATLLALAGLRRLGLETELSDVLDIDRMTPPMGQGTIGIEARANEWPVLFATLNHESSRMAARAERAFIRRVGGACHTPVGILARTVDGKHWELIAVLASPDGKHLMRRRIDAGADPVSAARELGASMFAAASPEIRATLMI